MKTEPGQENGEAASASVRRNTPRAARKRRSFSDIYDSDYDDSDTEYDPRPKSKRGKKEAVVNGDASPSRSRRSSKSRKSLSEEVESGRKSKRERKPSYKGKEGEYGKTKSRQQIKKGKYRLF